MERTPVTATPADTRMAPPARPEAARPGAAPVRLVPYGEGDFAQLVRHNTPEMTEHLGGPESDEQLRDRHRRYVGLDHRGRMYKILTADTGEAAGLVGCWETIHGGETVWEAGWGVLPEFQGRGIAVAATRLVAEEARGTGRHGSLHAFPAATNTASNAVCRKAGFTLVGSGDFEYPKGQWRRCNDWALDLRGRGPLAAA
ncbi:GNAT family N-acetyltransferase [Streptomyces sp. CC224B]|uniref:GNAT family N-acetyltransferase n=1 Tax=Streptomyces sp. CC224B TaxID=3044571 RepID=UPI0032BF3F65